jgi:hypothetical protein
MNLTLVGIILFVILTILLNLILLFKIYIGSDKKLHLFLSNGGLLLVPAIILMFLILLFIVFKPYF